MMPSVIIVGGGLAGCEAAYQCLKRGFAVELWEMRPNKMTEAHKTGDLAELVCSNSFKSLARTSASGLLKAEMQMFDSLVLESAKLSSVPAGQALAVDRAKFSGHLEGVLSSFSKFTRINDEAKEIPSAEELRAKNQILIVASGPLTSPEMIKALECYCGKDTNLFFYDAIAPVMDADSIDMRYAFWADRYGKGNDDYLNIALNKEEYEGLILEVKKSEKVPLHDFEKVPYFECCLPIEVMIERGDDTLRFGPMKPVGFKDPATGKRPWALLQLRKENEQGSMLSMVGFQTKMKWPEQKRVFQKIPALANAEFLRYGSVHKNTYINSPNVLDPWLRLQENNNVFIAGQLSGVEGYTESAASGLLAGINAAKSLSGDPLIRLPEGTMMGALMSFVTGSRPAGRFQPMNANLGLLPTITRRKGVSKADVKQEKCDKALFVMNTAVAEMSLS